jgi:hypothetical protein
MTPAGMVAFRKAAALVHSLPGLRLRITHDGTPLAEIGTDVCVRTEGLPRRLTPCQFRVALLRVLDGSTRARAISAFGLPAGVDPAIHLGVGQERSMAVHGFGLVAWADAQGAGCAFATTVRQALVEEVLADAGGHELVTTLVRDDEGLGTSLIELRSEHLRIDTVVGLARDLMVCCTVEELIAPRAAAV